MNAWKIILATLLIFGTGMVTGGLLAHRIQRHEDSDPRLVHTSLPRTNTPPGPGLDAIWRYQPQLHLTPEQRGKVDSIFKEGQERVKVCMQDVMPEIQDEVQKTLAEFRDVLTPQQQAQFDELLKQPPQSPQYPGMGKRGRGEAPGRGDLSGRGEPSGREPRFGDRNPARTNGVRSPWTNGFRPPWPPQTNTVPGPRL